MVTESNQRSSAGSAKGPTVTEQPAAVPAETDDTPLDDVSSFMHDLHI